MGKPTALTQRPAWAIQPLQLSNLRGQATLQLNDQLDTWREYDQSSIGKADLAQSSQPSADCTSFEGTNLIVRGATLGTLPRRGLCAGILGRLEKKKRKKKKGPQPHLPPSSSPTIAVGHHLPFLPYRSRFQSIFTVVLLSSPPTYCQPPHPPTAALLPFFTNACHYNICLPIATHHCFTSPLPSPLAASSSAGHLCSSPPCHCRRQSLPSPFLLSQPAPSCTAAHNYCPLLQSPMLPIPSSPVTHVSRHHHCCRLACRRCFLFLDSIRDLRP
ncbi:hypothetical protein BHM03_00029756 [Ensete ventricosum]|nr:hypothetical protein BHM03_00029756 [Ensete ventricosum]